MEAPFYHWKKKKLFAIHTAKIVMRKHSFFPFSQTSELKIEKLT